MLRRLGEEELGNWDIHKRPCSNVGTREELLGGAMIKARAVGASVKRRLVEKQKKKKKTGEDQVS
jgi:hypothetical protein